MQLIWFSLCTHHFCFASYNRVLIRTKTLSSHAFAYKYYLYNSFKDSHQHIIKRIGNLHITLSWTLIIQTAKIKTDHISIHLISIITDFLIQYGRLQMHNKLWVDYVDFLIMTWMFHVKNSDQLRSIWLFLCLLIENGYLHLIWTELWLRQPSVLFEISQNVPVINIRIRVIASRKQLP